MPDDTVDAMVLQHPARFGHLLADVGVGIEGPLQVSIRQAEIVFAIAAD